MFPLCFNRVTLWIFTAYSIFKTSTQSPLSIINLFTQFQLSFIHVVINLKLCLSNFKNYRKTTELQFTYTLLRSDPFKGFSENNNFFLTCSLSSCSQASCNAPVLLDTNRYCFWRESKWSRAAFTSFRIASHCSW